MRVLLATTFLNCLSGSEIFFFDLARGLRSRGIDTTAWILHRVPDAPLVRLLELAGVRMLDSPPRERYDAAVFQLKEIFPFFESEYMVIPRFAVCHGPKLPQEVASPEMKGVTHVALTQEGYDYLRHHGYPDPTCVPNGIDLDRFPPGPALPDRPSKAVIHCKYSDRVLIREVCADLGIEVLEIGAESWRGGADRNHFADLIEVRSDGTVVDHRPEVAAWNVGAHLNRADLGFGMGRSAAEILATGRACIAFGYERVGDGMVTRENVEHLAYANFSGRARAVEFDHDRLKAEILRYSPGMYRDNIRFARRRYDLQRALERWSRQGRRRSRRGAGADGRGAEPSCRCGGGGRQETAPKRKVPLSDSRHCHLGA